MEPARPAAPAPGVGLRPLVEADLAFLARLDTDPALTRPYLWTGFRDPRARARRWAEDGYLGGDETMLAVTAGGAMVGIVNWRARRRGGADGCFEIGILLDPAARGRGLGTAAQAELVDHLFATTTAHRLEAVTDRRNAAERRALERVGFSHEGVLRGAAFQDGAWQDLCVYGLLRGERRRGDR